MSEDGEDDGDVFWECYICSGENGRERKSEGSVICAHNSCVKEHTRRRKAARGEDSERTALALPPKAARTSCFKVRDVVGVDLCVTASERQRRAGRTLDEDNISYKVRGGFGEDKDDELIPDTRWVPLSELVANMDERTLGVLDKWAATLEKTAKELRKELRKRRA